MCVTCAIYLKIGVKSVKKKNYVYKCPTIYVPRCSLIYVWHINVFVQF